MSIPTLLFLLAVVLALIDELRVRGLSVRTSHVDIEVIE